MYSIHVRKRQGVVRISLRINLFNISHIEVRLSAGLPAGERDVLVTLDSFIGIRIPQRLGLTRRGHQEQGQNQQGFFIRQPFVLWQPPYAALTLAGNAV